MEKASKPLKIFISCGFEIDNIDKNGDLYSEPNNESVVLKIKEHLKSRGHEVWLDRDWLERYEIKDFPDRRKALYDGAKWSDVALVCLSPKALKTNGVCQDDVSIILNVLGENYIPIKLEAAKEKEYPSYLLNRQLISKFAEWDLKWTEGRIDNGGLEEAFEELDKTIAKSLEEKIKWQNEMAELKGALQPLEANDQLQIFDVNIQNHLNEKTIQAESEAARFFYEHKGLFEWFEEKIKHSGEAVRLESERVILLKNVSDFGERRYAEGLLNWYKFAFSDPYFIDNNQRETLDLHTFVKFVAYRLAKTNSSYREKLISYLKENSDEIDLQTDDPQMLFRLLVDDLLSDEIDGGKAIQWILVDSLDNATVSPRNSFASFISQIPNRLPPWICFLITTRSNDDTVNRYFAQITPIDLSKEDNCDI